ncbi:hypothetical protein SAMN04515695_0328 [Pseudovibrio sp. Tun.PSC04-5.I4]|nr:hypothetical protein SAMN04515695_0328 [Pseudovibrio sp. Tun.PSC04-5.I4]
MECPQKCSGHRSDRQRHLVPAEAQKLPKNIAESAEFKCTYCGCVYTRENIALGYLEDPMNPSKVWTPL